tara:strand:- start:56362 stop:56817 length:456 start_codon:yes stop_codon:yes gene_type:complete
MARIIKLKRHALTFRGWLDDQNAILIYPYCRPLLETYIFDQWAYDITEMRTRESDWTGSHRPYMYLLPPELDLFFALRRIEAILEVRFDPDSAPEDDPTAHYAHDRMLVMKPDEPPHDWWRTEPREPEVRITIKGDEDEPQQWHMMRMNNV